MPARTGRLCALALLAVLASGLLVSACAPRDRLLAVFFEGLPPEGKEAPPEPVVRQPRRTPYKPPAKPAPPPKAAEKPVAPDWAALFQKLPKAADGGADWMRALEEKLIAPKPGIGPEAVAQPVFDLDVERIPKGLPMFKVVFPHKAHTQWLACANCHPAIFQMQRGANPITMEKILAGEFCGRCHGKVAFAPTGCPRCHLAMPK